MSSVLTMVPGPKEVLRKKILAEYVLKTCHYCQGRREKIQNWYKIGGEGASPRQMKLENPLQATTSYQGKRVSIVLSAVIALKENWRLLKIVMPEKDMEKNHFKSIIFKERRRKQRKREMVLLIWLKS